MMNEDKIDEAVTKIYRMFKEWNKRGFTEDDVTWCEVRAEIVNVAKELIKERV